MDKVCNRDYWHSLGGCTIPNQHIIRISLMYLLSFDILTFWRVNVTEFVKDSLDVHTYKSYINYSYIMNSEQKGQGYLKNLKNEHEQCL